MVNCPNCGLISIKIGDEVLCSICGVNNVFELAKIQISKFKDKLRRRTEIGTWYCNFWCTVALMVCVLQIFFLYYFYDASHPVPEWVTSMLFVMFMSIMVIGNLHVNAYLKKYHPDLHD